MASALTMRHRLLHEQMDKKQRKRNLIRMKNVCVCVRMCVCIFVYCWSNHLFEEEWNIVRKRKTSVRCFLIGGISTVFVLYVVHLITTVASEIRGFVTNKLLVNQCRRVE